MTFAFLILGDFSPEQNRTASIGGRCLCRSQSPGRRGDRLH